jgi:adenosyl cobinamide kinase/adenosyl cobinamide phosphate guanylyltransferase
MATRHDNNQHTQRHTATTQAFAVRNEKENRIEKHSKGTLLEWKAVGSTLVFSEGAGAAAASAISKTTKPTTINDLDIN